MLKVIYELPCNIFYSEGMITICGKDKDKPRNYVYITRPFESDFCQVHSDPPEKLCKRAGSRILWAVWDED